jgi:hypothetical protein
MAFVTLPHQANIASRFPRGILVVLPDVVFQATEVIAFNRCTNFIDRTLGAIGSSYDLETIIEVAARWKAEDIFPFQIHFAGDSTQSEALEARCKQLALTTWKRQGRAHREPDQMKQAPRVSLLP